MIKKTATPYLLTLAVSGIFLPNIAFAGSSNMQIVCSGTTTGTCTVTLQATGFAPEFFNWRGTNIAVTPTGAKTATYSCTNGQIGNISAYSGNDDIIGVNSWSASLNLSC
jgi:hypothetical protein